MGRVRTKTVKRAARELIEKYYYKLNEDFHVNKKILDNVADISTKRLRNKIAGYTTHLMKRIQKGPVKGVSLKIQEEQREKLLDIIPKESNVQVDRKEHEVDESVLKMLKERGFDNMIKQRHVITRKVGFSGR
jgi:small subunit ribosomal protein S17e